MGVQTRSAGGCDPLMDGAGQRVQPRGAGAGGCVQARTRKRTVESAALLHRRECGIAATARPAAGSGRRTRRQRRGGPLDEGWSVEAAGGSLKWKCGPAGGQTAAGRANGGGWTRRRKRRRAGRRARWRAGGRAGRRAGIAEQATSIALLMDGRSVAQGGYAGRSLARGRAQARTRKHTAESATLLRPSGPLAAPGGGGGVSSAGAVP